MVEKPIDVVAAGHVCIDITPSFKSDCEGAAVSDIFKPGKLIDVGSPTISSGGSVSNTGLALKRLGMEVALMGKCGDDPFGEMLLEIIDSEAPGAGKGMSVVAGQDTSYSIVLVLPGKDRIFLHCPGANHTFSSGDIDCELIRRCRVFHFGYPPLMRLMFSDGGAELAEIMALAGGEGAVTSLDLALPDPGSEAGRADWPGILSSALPHTNLFLPSIEELMYMLNRTRFDELTAGEGGVTEGFTASDLREMADECLALGADITVIKCGHIGAYIKCREPLRGMEIEGVNAQEWAGVEQFEPACRVDHIQSASGAGDCSIAGFLTAFIKGMNPEECMKALSVVGAQNLSGVSAVDGVQTWEHTLEQMKGERGTMQLPERLSGL